MDFFSVPPYYSNYAAKLIEIKQAFPFIKLFSIGSSVLGRKIFAVGIGNQSNVSLFAGAFHAQEWLTTSLLVRFIEHICFAVREDTTIADVRIRQPLSQRGIVFVPMVNPDGVSIALEGAAAALKLSSFVGEIQSRSNNSWQANARGVDLNHNFDAGFLKLKTLERQANIYSPAPRQYGGEFPHSEPETAALVGFLRSHCTHSVYAFHSQGEEIFYEYGNNINPKAKFLATLFQTLSGYTIVKNSGLCSYGGFKDYCIENYKLPAFTIEIGKGVNPLPISDLEDIYVKLLETMVAMALL